MTTPPPLPQSKRETLSESDPEASNSSHMTEATVTATVAPHLAEAAREDAGGLLREPSRYVGFSPSSHTNIGSGGLSASGLGVGTGTGAGLGLGTGAGVGGAVRVPVHSARAAILQARGGSGNSAGNDMVGMTRGSSSSSAAGAAKNNVAAAAAASRGSGHDLPPPATKRGVGGIMFQWGAKARSGGGTDGGGGGRSNGGGSGGLRLSDRRGSDKDGENASKHRHHRHGRQTPRECSDRSGAGGGNDTNCRSRSGVGADMPLAPGAFAIDETSNAVEPRPRMRPWAVAGSGGKFSANTGQDESAFAFMSSSPSSPDVSAPANEPPSDYRGLDRSGGRKDGEDGGLVGGAGAGCGVAGHAAAAHEVECPRHAREHEDKMVVLSEEESAIHPSRRDLVQPPGTEDNDDDKKDGFPRNCNFRRRAIVCAIVATAVIVVVAVPLAVARRGRGSNGGEWRPRAGDDDATTGDVLEQQQRMDGLRDALLYSTYDAPDSNLFLEGTPQYDALRWLAYEDEFDMSSNGREGLIERYVLAVLYYSTNGGSWISSDGWLLPGSDVCGWHGIGCKHAVNRTVTSINLSGNSLKGTIPADIGALAPSLEVLLLSENRLSGTMPLKLFDLVSLEKLILSENEIGGTIPSTIGKLSNLRTLDLYTNMLQGTLVSEIGNLKKLVRLDVGVNEMNETIPSSILNLVHLEELRLSNNDFTGTLLDFGALGNLRHLYLDSNSIDGGIPKSIGSLAFLKSLYLHQNQLTSTIPEEMGNLASLVHLDMELNLLTGTIPSTLGNLDRLETFVANRNKFEGTVPSEICALSNSNSFIFDCRVGCKCCDMCTN